MGVFLEKFSLYPSEHITLTKRIESIFCYLILAINSVVFTL